MATDHGSRWVLAAALATGCANGGDVGETDAGSDATSAESGGPPPSGSAGGSDGVGESGSTAPGTGTATTSDAETSAGSEEGDTGPDVDDTTGGFVGQTIVIGVGNWGHRGTTEDGVRWVDVMNEPPKDGNDHTPDLLRGIGYGDGKFVAVGGDANGMIMSTIDGATWDEDLFPQGDGWLGDVAWQDGVWVAVGGNGIVVRSTDGGTEWTQSRTGLSFAGRTIIAAEGKLVAAGDGGGIAVSDDLGLTWDESTDPSGLGFSLAHGLDTFVGFASQWNGSGFDTACIVSGDAIAWSPCPLVSSAFGSPAAGEGAIVVQMDGGYGVTTDGAQWDTVEGELPDALVQGDGVWVGISYQRRWHAPSYAGPWESVENVDGFRDLTAGAVAR
jgi:hypothetical protein